MTKLLDPRFAKLVAVIRSTGPDPEKASARGRAEIVAKASGRTFEAALAELDGAASSPRQKTFFEEMEDAFEASEPGYKAKRAREHAEKLRQCRERAAAAINRYGSKQAVLSFTAWDLALLESPLPATFRNALDEFNHWETRNQEMEDVLGSIIGNLVLKFPAYERYERLRGLVRHDIPITTACDLLVRFEIFHRHDMSTQELEEEAILRDLKTLAKAEANRGDLSAKSDEHLSMDSEQDDLPSKTRSRTAEPSRRIRGLDIGEVEARLRANPHLTDREVARSLGCSPTTVGKIRRQANLSTIERSVHRNGQTYKFRTSASRQ